MFRGLTLKYEGSPASFIGVEVLNIDQTWGFITRNELEMTSFNVMKFALADAHDKFQSILGDPRDEAQFIQRINRIYAFICTKHFKPNGAWLHLGKDPQKWSQALSEAVDKLAETLPCR